MQGARQWRCITPTFSVALPGYSLVGRPLVEAARGLVKGYPSSTAFANDLSSCLDPTRRQAVAPAAPLDAAREWVALGAGFIPRR
jgi:hypothetical protein